MSEVSFIISELSLEILDQARNNPPYGGQAFGCAFLFKNGCNDEIICVCNATSFLSSKNNTYTRKTA